MPKNKQTTAAEPVAEKKPPCDPAKLGTKLVTSITSVAVKVGETDMGKDVVTWQNKPQQREEVGPDLSLEDAMSLEDGFGEQDWQPWSDTGQFFVKFTEAGASRRFIITGEIYAKLRE